MHLEIHPHSLWLSHTHIRTHTLASCPASITMCVPLSRCSHTLSVSLCLSHTHIYTHIHTHKHTLSHTHIHTLTSCPASITMSIFLSRAVHTHERTYTHENDSSQRGCKRRIASKEWYRRERHTPGFCVRNMSPFSLSHKAARSVRTHT